MLGVSLKTGVEHMSDSKHDPLCVQRKSMRGIMCLLPLFSNAYALEGSENTREPRWRGRVSHP